MLQILGYKNMASFKLAQLSDTHVVRKHSVLSNGVDSNQALRAAVYQLIKADDIDVCCCLAIWLSAVKSMNTSS